MTIRTLIVDDEPHAVEIIKKYSANIPEIEVVDTCNNAIKAFQILQNTKVDLLFLDIKMPGLSGTDLVRSLKYPPMIIFTTAYQEYAIDGFDLNAVDYLLKPIPLNRFLRAIDKVMQLTNGDRNEVRQETYETNTAKASTHYLYLRIERRLIKVNTKDILWIESMKDYIKVVTVDKSYTTKQKISVVEKLLPISEFMRIHRSYIIPVNKAEGYHPNHILIAGNKIPVGRNYKQACYQKFNPEAGMNYSPE
ncbi:MAG: response regulator transcription factor [Chitinophagaceae bacterium]|nr:response regulator transcription factor [Chitinophagaceae bacterium]